MGIFIQLTTPQNTEIMINRYIFLTERLTNYFNFELEPPSILLRGIPNTQMNQEILKEYEDLNAESLNQEILNDKDKLKSINASPRYSIISNGIIHLKNLEEKSVPLEIDVKCTTNLNYLKLYGSIWITFYSYLGTSIKELFCGDENNQIYNREHLFNLFNDLKIESYLKSIYFWDDNSALYDFSNNYYIYFKEYRYFIDEIYDLIVKKLSVENLEKNKFLMDENIFETIKADLKYLDEKYIKNTIEQSVDFLKNYGIYANSEYNVIIAESSVEIFHPTFKHSYIKNIINDYIENFGESLIDSIPRESALTGIIQKSLNTHTFKKGNKKRQQKITKY